MRALNPQVWGSAADDVLSVLLTEQYTDEGLSGFNHAFYEKGLMTLHFPQGKHRALFQAIADLRTKKRPVTWNSIADITSGAITQQWYTELCTLCDPIRIADFNDNAAMLLEYGERAIAVDVLESAAADIREGKDREQVIDTVVSEVTSGASHDIHGETAREATKNLRARLSVPAEMGVPTGFDFIDEVTGGIRKGRMTVLAGAYKSRKTTTGMNVVLNAYRGGLKPAILSYENTIETMHASLTAMLAVDWLLKENKVPYSPEAPVYWISPDSLLQAGSGYKKWTPLKVQAIEWALEEMDRIGDGIRFYDTSETGGELSDMRSIRRVVKRDMRLYGGDVYLVDHQGLVDADGEIYEHTRNVSKAFQRLSRITSPHQISLWVIAQLNESAIQNGAGYSAGVKGGGDTSANVDYLITTNPVQIPGMNGDFYDDRTELKVKFNRWGGTTPRKPAFFHPESGLKMEGKTVDLKELSTNGKH